jgi:uncharacterized protein YceH (UPF0502 family)
MTDSTLPQLSFIESRVLGVLVEKERTVPDTYPLSLNALTAGCNQKSSRDPVIEATESDVREAIDSLRRRSWVIESSGGRVMRYSHNVKRVLGVASQAVALLAMLMLRGPQTAAELRANCERLERFADVSSVEAFLSELVERPQGALVVLLPRQSGAREPRWAQLLCGPVSVASNAADRDGPGLSPTQPTASVAGAEPMAALETRVAALEAELAQLRQALEPVLAAQRIGLDSA